jgi:hypothetical protein
MLLNTIPTQVASAVVKVVKTARPQTAPVALAPKYIPPKVVGSGLGQRTPEEVARIKEHKREAEEQRQRQQGAAKVESRQYKAPAGTSKLERRSPEELTALQAAKRQAEGERAGNLSRTEGKYVTPMGMSSGMSTRTAEDIARWHDKVDTRAEEDHRRNLKAAKAGNTKFVAPNGVSTGFSKRPPSAGASRPEIKASPAASLKKSPPVKKGGKFPRVEKVADEDVPYSSAERDDLMNSIFARLAGDDSSTKQTPPSKSDSQPQTKRVEVAKCVDSLTFTVGGDEDEEDEMF